MSNNLNLSSNIKEKGKGLREMMVSLGRRKEATARVFYFFNKKKKITINNKKKEEYFRMNPDLVNSIAFEPLNMLGQNPSEFSLKIIVKGGGISAQAQSISLALARLLVKIDPENKKVLRDSNLLTRDPRAKERRKPGLVKARKKFPFVKR